MNLFKKTVFGRWGIIFSTVLMISVVALATPAQAQIERPVVKRNISRPDMPTKPEMRPTVKHRNNAERPIISRKGSDSAMKIKSPSNDVGHLSNRFSGQRRGFSGAPSFATINSRKGSAFGGTSNRQRTGNTTPSFGSSAGVSTTSSGSNTTSGGLSGGAKGGFSGENSVSTPSPSGTRSSATSGSSLNNDRGAGSFGGGLDTSQ